MNNIIALSHFLKHFQPYFEMQRVTEVCINKPYEVWVEQGGRFMSFEAPAFSESFLYKFASLAGEYNGREISPEYPTLSSILPDGSRVQFVIEPACEKGSFICSIRRKTVLSLPLKKYF